jgi:hypothetical protein
MKVSLPFMIFELSIYSVVIVYHREPLSCPCIADSGASLPEGVSPIDIGALIKCYLASIPDPLTTFALYDELRDARVSIPAIRNILKKLPNVNYMMLEFVTALLLRVSCKSSLNKVHLIPVLVRYFSLLCLPFVLFCFALWC